ncbi:MAG: phosphoadenosine phosphosulfate reductase [Pseudomonadota bacterium]
MSSDYPQAMDASLAGLDWSKWLDRMQQVTDEDGFTEPLGENHAAILVENNTTLLVTFECFEDLEAQSNELQPFGWKIARTNGWSHLCITSKTTTWFREPRVYGFFDRMVDDGFFDEFDQVIFYGAGSCGYAAAAFSVAAPGARVFLIQPQATLDPRLAEWDQRYRKERRRDFTTRYGFAPDMLDACEKGVLLYDPNIEEDAMHSALFSRSNIMRFRMRHMGGFLDRGLMRVEILEQLINNFAADTLTLEKLAHIYRARRNDVPYLKGLLFRLEDEGRWYQIARLCQHVMRKRPGPRFRRALRTAYERAEQYGIAMPPKESF